MKPKRKPRVWWVVVVDEPEGTNAFLVISKKIALWSVKGWPNAKIVKVREVL